jgi:dTDP-4-amino-4,6-dideoxygalactose transaminase
MVAAAARRCAVVTAPADLIRFNVPHVPDTTGDYLLESLASRSLCGDGPFTARATTALSQLVGGRTALLTTSCTHALELAWLLLRLQPGDEVIMPSFTFVSTANAVALRGAVPVFVDIRPDTLNIDERLIEQAITPRTRAICVVHYAGVACAMDEISVLAARHDLAVVEDNAHGLGGSYRGRPLGTLGVLAAQSFHETKNLQCGEGGALVFADDELAERAEILREKGTNRSRFIRGVVDKYTWVDVGSSYLPSDLLAAALLAGVEDFDVSQAARQSVWSAYDDGLRDWAATRGVRTPFVPDDCEQPAHMYWLVLPSHDQQSRLIAHLKERGIVAPFHYLPLHTSEAGVVHARPGTPCPVTDVVAESLVRLPLHTSLSTADVDHIISSVLSFGG